MKFKDFITGKVNLEDIDTVIEEPVDVEPTVIEPRVRIADVVNKIMEQEANSAAEDSKVIATVVEPAISNSLTAKTYNMSTDVKSARTAIGMKLDDLAIVITELLDIVRKYQLEPETINESALAEFKAKLNVLNSMAGTSFNTDINSESDFEGYVELMTKILTNVAEDISILKSELATFVSKVISELNGLKVEKYKEVVAKTLDDIKAQPAKVVTVADHILEVVAGMENITREALIENIKHHEYIISGANETEGTMEDNISMDTGLRDEQIDNIVAAVESYIKVANSNPIVKVALTGGDLSKTLTSFTVNLLPKLNSVYKGILEILGKENFESEVGNTTDNVKNEINKQLVALVDLTVKDEESNITYVHHKDGFYSVEGNSLVKENYPITKVPNLSYDRFTTIATSMEVVNTPSDVLVSFPDTIVKLLKSDAFEVTDTKQLFSVNVALGTILGLVGLYRDEVVYGIYGLQKSLSELGLAYLNIILTLKGKSK